ncbi:SRCN1 inhibitor, partial [Eudromia elegans]|nr:SRCN1 inhibitor [Eudromia elegans]
IAPETDFSKGLDLETPPSPPVSLHHLPAVPEPLGMPAFGHSPPQSHPGKSNNPARAPEMVPAKTQTAPETPSKKSADKAVSVEAAERDWEEKRAALTQYSAKDINRLLEETQAELMKAIPDLEFAAKHKAGAGSAASTPEHKPCKPQHAQKAPGKGDANGRRGSDELTVPRYRTEKPSKSPPPPPPRRSFPSSHGLTTTRSGEVIVTSKKEPGFMKKAESEELETQKPQVKLRRTVSEVVRPASTPPIIASAIKDDDDEDRIIAELEVFQRSSASPFLPKLRYEPLAAAVFPGHADLWPNGASVAALGWKEAAGAAASGAASLPRIVLSEWVSQPPSPEAEPEAPEGSGAAGHGDGSGAAGAERAPVGAGGGSADAPTPGRLREGKRWASLGLLEAAARGGGSASATRPRSGPSCAWGSAVAAAAPPSPGASGEGTCPPGHRGPPPGLAGPAGGGCGGRSAAGSAAGRGSGASTLEATAPAQGARARLCPVPKRGACGGADPEEPGSGEPPAEHPEAPAAPGWSSPHPPARGEAAGMESGTGGTTAAGPCPLGARGRCREDPSPGQPMTRRSREVCEGTYRRLDSLEETIRELELTISEISSHAAGGGVFPREPLGADEPEDAGKGREAGPGRPARGCWDRGRVPPSTPRAQLREALAHLFTCGFNPFSPFLCPPQSGGVSIPPMKMVNPASRLKQSPQGSPDKSKHIKQRLEYVRIQGQQQVVHL